MNGVPSPRAEPRALASGPVGRHLFRLVLLAALMLPAPAPAQTATVAAASGATLQLSTNRGRLITLTRPMSDLFVANPDIADVQVRSPTQIYVFGKKPGETTVSATARGGAVLYTSTVRVVAVKPCAR